MVEPGDVLRIVLVQSRERLLLFPCDDMSPLDTMLWLSRDRCNGAQRNGSAGSVHVELALNTGCHGRKYDSGLALEALSPTINQRLDGVGVFGLLGDRYQHGIDPTACLDAVESTDNKLELLVELLIKILNAVVMGSDGDALDSVLDKLGGDFCFILANVVLAKEELTVQVRDVNGVYRPSNLAELSGNRGYIS